MMKQQHSSTPDWANVDSQHPRGVPVVMKDEYWLYAEESPEGWHITGVRENAQHGLSEVYIPAGVDGKPVVSMHLDWTYDPEHPQFVGQLVFPDCIPGIDGRSLRYVLRAQVVKTEKPCYVVKENLLLTQDGRRVVMYLTMHQRYYFVPEGVEVIGENAFFECHMQRVYLPESLRCMENGAFWDTPWMLDMEIPEGVTHIGAAAFANSSARVVTLPDSLEELGTGAFAGAGILEVTIPPRVCKLDKTFKYCTALRRVHLSEGLEEIGPYTFQACEGLQRIVLPSTVTKVDDDAFAECDAEIVRG